MTPEQTAKFLVEKAFEIAEIMFASDERQMSISEIKNRLGAEFSDYSTLIRNSLNKINKIENIDRKGLRYVPAQKRKPELTPNDKKEIESYLIPTYKETLNKTDRKAPEFAVQTAFEKWIKEKHHREDEEQSDVKQGHIINFRQDARKSGKWKNVDGYLIETLSLSYHLMFRPILTTYEVKAAIPKKDDINQAENYRKFSHFVYLVFLATGSNDEIKQKLTANQYQLNNGVGVYITRDGEQFEVLHDSILQNPLDKEVDQALHELLSEDDKEELRTRKYRFIQENFIKAIS